MTYSAKFFCPGATTRRHEELRNCGQNEKLVEWYIVETPFQFIDSFYQ
jgi:hypothetical protein